MYCPIISTPDNKIEPNSNNCKDCYFYMLENQTNATYCAIRLAAERAVNITETIAKLHRDGKL